MRRTPAHSTFARTMALITVGTPIGDTLEAIVQAVEAEDPAIACSIYLFDRASQRLTLAAAPSLPADYGREVAEIPIGPKMGSCGTAAFRDERVIVEDIQTDPLWADFKHLAAAAGLAACWSQPIRGPQGEVLGTFAIYHRKVGGPDAASLSFIESAAQLASLAIIRQQADERLARSEARAAQAEHDVTRTLTTFFDVSLDMLCVRDMARRFVKVNQAWETVLGYTIEELEGALLTDFVHPDDVVSTHGKMDHLHSEGEVHGFTNRYRRKDGEYRDLEWRARRVGDLVFGVARDVTERLALEAERTAAQQAAEAANRAKSDFLANMSHEIRTPLNGVIGVVAALAQTELTPAQREMVGLIERSGVTLERLVSDVLDFSKIEAGRLEIEARMFDLRTELGGVLDVFRGLAEEKNLAFPIEYGPLARGEFLGDDLRIKQVLANLLSNAVKFTVEGEVRVKLDVTEPTEPGRPSVLVLEIEDTGVGFEAGFSTQLFQRFSQADPTITRRFGGTGLGLSITLALVEIMGGEITAESELGRGSRFRAVLPLLRSRSLEDYDRGPAPAADAVIAPEEEAASPLAELRILLAEDHPINQRVVQLILSPFDVRLTTVENGAEAVEAFTHGDFDLVLMDMQMPVMDGLAATRAIRTLEAAGPFRTPIVMLSANAMRQHRLDAEAAGADLHLAKPITAATLIRGMMDALQVAEASSAEGLRAAQAR